MTTIQPCIQYDETFSRDDAVEILANATGAPKPELASDVRFNRDNWAKDIRFSRDITCLEFSFKPIRMITIDLPGKNGKVEKTLVWYMVYSVTNKGDSLQSVVAGKPIPFPEQTTMSIASCNCRFCTSQRAVEPDKKVGVQVSPVLKNQQGAYEPHRIAEPFLFAPQFLIASDRIVDRVDTNVDPKTGEITRDVERVQEIFPEQIIPLALDAITQRENPGQKLETTVSISRSEIKPNETRWGVATWVDIDPRINFFSVFVGGLTNAYRWENEKIGDKPAFKKGDPIGSKRQFYRKTLKLNFWRPGDQFEQNERQIRYGTLGEVDYEWVYH